MIATGNDLPSTNFISKLFRERIQLRETLEALLCETQGLRDELEGVKRERDEARKDLDEEMKFHHRTHGECVMAQCELMDVKNERDEARIQYRSTLALAEVLANTQIKLKKERDEAREALTTIATDCEAWLNSEIDEPSMEFIKAVRDYAKKAI